MFGERAESHHSVLEAEDETIILLLDWVKTSPEIQRASFPQGYLERAWGSNKLNVCLSSHEDDALIRIVKKSNKFL